MPALRSRLAAFSFLSLAFIALSGLVAAGRFDRVDRGFKDAFGKVYSEPAHPFLQAIAVLGGVEITGLVVLGLGLWLWQRGFRDELWALTGFAVIVVLELIYKKLLFHPGPPAGHADGPSISDLIEPVAALRNSYPSGHVLRAVFAYGLLAFVIHRLGPGGIWARAVVLAAAVLSIAGVAFTRLYLAVHWESDVLGGMLLGGIGLLGATIWLDRPRPEGG